MMKRKRKILYTVSEMQIGVTTMENIMEGPQEKLKLEPPCDLKQFTSWYISKENKYINLKRYM